MKTFCIDDINYHCIDCNDGYCCLCISKRVDQNDKLYKLLNNNDVLGSVLNDGIIFEIVSFIKGSVITFRRNI